MDKLVLETLFQKICRAHFFMNSMLISIKSNLLCHLNSKKLPRIWPLSAFEQEMAREAEGVVLLVCCPWPAAEHQ